MRRSGGAQRSAEVPSSDIHILYKTKSRNKRHAVKSGRVIKWAGKLKVIKPGALKDAVSVANACIINKGAIPPRQHLGNTSHATFVAWAV